MIRSVPTSSTSFPSPWRRRIDPTAGSTSSIRRTKISLKRWGGEFNISGFQNKDLRRLVKGKNTGQVSRLMKRLRIHGMTKKIGRTYKYYLTGLGKQVIALGLKLKNLYVIPELSAVPAC